jgi:AcrR family transcriptional regulator
MSPSELPSRRERQRAETRDEVKQLALAQMEGGGAGALSLNAVAKAMGMTGPALYRYYASRDVLLTELIVEAYTDLFDRQAAAVADAAGRGRDAADQLRAASHAYRRFALAEPARFQLLFGTPVPGYHAPAEQTTPAAQRGMALVVELVAAHLGIRRTSRRARETAVAAWALVHGLTVLEVQGHLTDLVADCGRLLDAEVDRLLAAP